MKKITLIKLMTNVIFKNLVIIYCKFSKADKLISLLQIKAVNHSHVSNLISEKQVN